MADFYIKVDPSFEKLAQSFKKTGKNIDKALRDIINEFAFLTERYAKQVTPVQTGRLRSSISVSNPIGSNGFSARVGTWGVHYAGFVHEGTRRMHARQFLRWGVQFAQEKFNDNTISSRLSKEVREDLSKL